MSPSHHAEEGEEEESGRGCGRGYGEIDPGVVEAEGGVGETAEETIQRRVSRVDRLSRYDAKDEIDRAR